MILAVIQTLADRWTSLAIIAMTLAALALSALTVRSVEENLSPLLRLRAQVIAETAQRDIGLAIAKGIPIAEYDGLDAYARDLASRDPLISQVIIHPLGLGISPRPDVAMVRQQVRIPQDNGARDLMLYIDVRLSQSALRERMIWTVFDIVMLTLAAIVFVLRVPLVLFRLGLSRPLALTNRVIAARAAGDLSVPRLFKTWSRQLDRFLDRLDSRKTALALRLEFFADVVAEPRPLQAFAEQHGLGKRLRLVRPGELDVQVPLFLILFCDALILPILPLYARDLSVVGGIVPQSFALALPLTAGMLAIALAAYLAAEHVPRQGRRGQALLAALLFCLGQALASSADTTLMLTIARSLAGAGIGLALAAIDGYALAANRSGGTRTATFSTLTTVAISAEVSGGVIGALLADVLDPSALFVVSSGMGLMAGLAVAVLMRRHGLTTSALRTGRSRRPLGHPALRLGLMGLVLPVAIISGGVWVFALPLLLSQAGLSNGEVARTLSLLPIAMLLLVPVLRKIMRRIGSAELTNGCALIVIAGCIVIIGLSSNILHLVAAAAFMALGLAAVRARTTSFLQNLGTSGAEAVAPENILRAERTTTTLGMLCAPVLINFALPIPEIGFPVIALMIGLAGVILTISRAHSSQEESYHA